MKLCMNVDKGWLLGFLDHWHVNDNVLQVNCLINLANTTLLTCFHSLFLHDCSYTLISWKKNNHYTFAVLAPWLILILFYLNTNLIICSKWFFYSVPSSSFTQRVRGFTSVFACLSSLCFRKIYLLMSLVVFFLENRFQPHWTHQPLTNEVLHDWSKAAHNLNYHVTWL